jgi:hypothetical protein
MRKPMERFNLDVNMEKIKGLAQELNEHPLMFTKEDIKVEYKVTSGSCIGYGLINNGGIAAQHFVMEPNTELLPHTHKDEREIIIIYEGDFTSINKYRVQSVANSGLVCIDIGITHIAKSINGCKGLAITIPSSEGYPDAK